MAKSRSSSADIKRSGNDDQISKATLIWRAVKLPNYAVALVPVTVGTAAAYTESGYYASERYFFLLASFVLLHAWANLSNDVYDFDTGADVNKRESVVNITGRRTAINILSMLLLALGFAGICWVGVEAKSPHAVLLLVAAIFCGYVYQFPPYRLSYHGLGEPLVFAAYGPFATVAFYLLQSRSSDQLPISSTIVFAAILVGLTTGLILFCSHFHQIDDDKAAGKISPLVRLGTENGSKVVKFAVLVFYWIVIGLGLAGILPYACVVLYATTLPLGNFVVNYVQEYHEDKTKIFMSKFFCVRLHTASGAALAAGLAASRVYFGEGDRPKFASL